MKILSTANQVLTKWNLQSNKNLAKMQNNINATDETPCNNTQGVQSGNRRSELHENMKTTELDKNQRYNESQ